MDAHKNFAYTTVDTAPSPADSGTSLTLPAGHGARFPTAPFNATVCATGEIPIVSNAEIVRVTAKVGDVLTIVRAQEGTSARTIVVGDQIFASITVKSLTDIEDAIPSVAGLLSAVNVSAGSTSQNLSALTFSNGSGVTFGLNGSVVTAQVETNYQSPGAYLTTAALSQDSSKYAGTNGAITGGSITVNTAGVSVDLPAYLTTAMLSNAVTLSNVKVSAGGASALLSAVTLADSNGISFGLNGSTLTASHNGLTSQSNQAFSAQGGSSAFQTLAFSNGNGATFTNTNGQVGLSYTVPSTAGLISAVNVSGGTTSNNLSAITFSNANGVSFGLNGSVLTGSVAAAAGAQTGLSGLVVSDATYTSGTIYLSNAGNITISSSVNGASQYVRLSGNAAQTNQSAIKGFGVSNTGNTAGNTGISTGIDWALAASGLLTLSQSTAVGGPNTVWLQHPAWLTTARASTDGVGLATAQSNVTWTVNSAGLSLDARGYAGSGFTSAGNNIGLSGTHNSNGLSLSATVAAQSNQSAIKAFGVSNTGQTAGNTGVSTGVDWVLAGSGSITLSQSTTAGGPNTVWMQHPSWLTTAALSQDSSKYAGTNGAITGGSITVNTSGVSINLPAYLTTAAQSTQTLGFTLSGNLATTNSSQIAAGGYALAGGNNVTIQQSNNTVSISVGNYITTADLSQNSSKYVHNWKLTGNTAGTTSSAQGTDLWFSGGNSITVSGNSNSIVFSVGNYITTGRASTDAIGLNTAKSNVTWTVNSSGISFDARGYAGTGTSATNASITLDSGGLAISVAAQSNQTIGGYALGNTTGQSSSSTFDARTVSISGAGNISVGYSGSNLIISGGTAAAAPLNFSAGTTSGDIGSVVFSNSNGVSFGLNGSTITASVAGGSPNISAGTTSNNLGSIVFSNSNGVSFGLNGSTITGTVSTYSTVGTATTVYPVASANSVGTVTRWAAEDHRHAGIGAIGISTGNTSGTSGSVQGTYWIQGSGNLTVSQITSNNGSHTLNISAPSVTIGFYEPMPQTNTAGLALAAGSWYFVPFIAHEQMSGGRINFLHVNTSTAGIVRDITGGSYVSSSSGGKNQSYTYSKAAALYSLGTGTNSTRLESFWSNSFSFGLSHRVLVSQSGANSSVSVTVSQSISYISEIGSDGAYTLNQFASNNNSNGTNTSIASNALDSVGVSVRNMLSNSLVVPIGFNTTIQPGAYWLAVAWSSTTASATSQTSFAGASALIFSELSQIGISRLELNTLFRNWGSTATTARSQLMPSGVYTGAANMAPPQFVALSSDLSSVASQWVPYFNFQMRGLTK